MWPFSQCEVEERSLSGGLGQWHYCTDSWLHNSEHWGSFYLNFARYSSITGYAEIMKLLISEKQQILSFSNCCFGEQMQFFFKCVSFFG